MARALYQYLSRVALTESADTLDLVWGGFSDSLTHP